MPDCEDGPVRLMMAAIRPSGSGRLRLEWILGALGIVAAQAQTAAEVVLHNFGSTTGAPLSV